VEAVAAKAPVLAVVLALEVLEVVILLVMARQIYLLLAEEAPLE